MIIGLRNKKNIYFTKLVIGFFKMIVHMPYEFRDEYINKVYIFIQ